MRHRPIFLVDVDDVLADLSTKVKVLLSGILDREWKFEEMAPEDWYLFSDLAEHHRSQAQSAFSDYNWVWSIEPLPGAQDAVKELRGMADVYVVTASVDWAPVRIQWLKEHFDFEKHELVFTESKHLVDGDFFLDDHPGNVCKWQKFRPHGWSILWESPVNSHLDVWVPNRVSRWESVFEMVKNST